MPFDDLEFVAAPMKAVQASISYRRIGTRNGRSKMPKLIIGLPAAVLTGFKPKESQLFTLQVGSGADAGKARIVPATEGVKAMVRRGGATFRFGYVPMLGDDQAEKEFVAVKATKDGFEIVLPAWFKPE